LRALWQHPPYFHDGKAANLAAQAAVEKVGFSRLFGTPPAGGQEALAIASGAP
jgi:hypothetical protein